MSLISKDVPHRSLLLDAGGRKIEMLTAQVAPTATSMEVDAFADFCIGDEIRGAGITCIGSDSGVMHYTGIIPHDLMSHDYPVRLRNLVYTILKNVRRQPRHSSLLVNFSDDQPWRHMPAVFDYYLGVVEGVRRYAELVADEQPASHVREIVIGCGMLTFINLNAALQMPQGLTRFQAIFPMGVGR